MNVKVRRYKRGGWEVDVTIRLPDGQRFRERTRAAVRSRTAATRWGESREQFLLLPGRPQPVKEVPTLEQFADRFVDGHARANQQKPSGIATKEAILRVHLKPLLGSKRLDGITAEQVHAAVADLEGPFREVYELRLISNCSYDEIADKLTIPRSTVGTRLLRARQKLKSRLLDLAA